LLAVTPTPRYSGEMMIRSIPPFLLLAAILAPALTGAAELLAGPVPATVVEVIDGDTITVRARIWLGQAIETRVRLAGIDTPELRGDCERERILAEQARAALAARIAGRQVTLTEIRRGTYAGRVVARVSGTDTPDIGQTLLAAGLARTYGGRGPRPDWCGG